MTESFIVPDEAVSAICKHLLGWPLSDQRVKAALTAALIAIEGAGWKLVPDQEPTSNVINLHIDDGRNEEWKFPCGTILRISVPEHEPPITAAHAVYCLSSALHQIHKAMYE